MLLSSIIDIRAVNYNKFTLSFDIQFHRCISGNNVYIAGVYTSFFSI